jgi:ribosomal protein S18 acetylase RimI-like enzyme
MQIRVFQHGDHEAIANIFTQAIHEIASREYTREQCLAWSSRQPDVERWRRRCELKRPFVATVDSQIAAFLELDPDGHIDCAYVHPAFQRRGIVTRLVQHAVAACFEMGVNRVYVEASLCARPMFAKLGFQVQRENLVKIGQESLKNYAMELTRDLPSGHASPAGPVST